MSEKTSESMIQDAQRLRALGTFSGKVAHEFNNLLTPLLAYPQIIRDMLPPELSQQAEMLDVIDATARDMARLSHQMSVLSSGGCLGRHSTELNPVVSRAVDDLRSQTDLESINMATDLGKDTGAVMGASDDLYIIACNLCINAIEALGGKGAIIVRTERTDLPARETAYGSPLPAGTYVHLSVRDNGAGIAEEIKNRIYEPFVTTRKCSESRRLGFGLTIVYKIVREYGGDISFESEKGKGTVFNIYLPACTA